MLFIVFTQSRLIIALFAQVAEFDSPKVLLENPESLFRSLAVEAGLA